MIKIVLFDFGGVLTESGKKGFISEMLAELYGLQPEDVRIGDLHGMLRRGKGTEKMFFDELNRRFHGNVTKEMFLASAGLKSEPSKPVYDLAARLRQHGIRTGILSNVFAMNAEQLRTGGRYDGFEPVILSCEQGYAKPDKEFYDIAVKMSGVEPHEILFIDDQNKCMPPAQMLGMRTLVAVSPEQIVADTEAIIRRENGIEL